MNVQKILKHKTTIIIGLLTLIAFILFVNSGKARAAEPSKSQTKQGQLGTALEQTKPDTLNNEVPVKRTIKDNDVEWLAKNIYHESRGQSIRGQYAVAIVTMNRVESGKFPNSVQKVVTQPGQFSWYRNKSISKIRETDSYNIAKDIARNVLERSGSLYTEVHNKLKGAQYFHEKSIKTPSRRRVVIRIEDHVFYI
jgi:spore germination cell wall hydrolase CwlJ-like protein